MNCFWKVHLGGKVREVLFRLSNFQLVELDGQQIGRSRVVFAGRDQRFARGLKVIKEESTPFTALQRASPSWNSVVQVEIAVSSYCVLNTLAFPDKVEIFGVRIFDPKLVSSPISVYCIEERLAGNSAYNNRSKVN